MEQGHICKPGSARESSVAIDTRANAQAPATVDTVIEGEMAEDIIEKCYRVPSHTLPVCWQHQSLARLGQERGVICVQDGQAAPYLDFLGFPL